MRRQSNGTQISLEQAIALLIQNQAAFLVSSREAEERFRRIERDFEEIKTILLRHERILSQLPEAIREKIGFKAK